MTDMPRRGLVFGCFDGLHEGHLRFLEQAFSKVDHLGVALATDEAIKSLKSVHPHQSYEERSRSLLDTGLVDSIYPSEPHNGYIALTALNPDIVIFGHDQSELSEHLRHWLKEHKIDIETTTLEAFQPEKYKTSKLYDRRKIIS